MKKNDVVFFHQNFERELFNLHSELVNGSYRHGDYTSFSICDPKRRTINKADVRDRVVHHAIHRAIEPYFDQTFIYDSYSSRVGKGTLKAIERVEQFCWKISKNNTRTVWLLKCDIKKFFDSVDHEILEKMLTSKIHDTKLLQLLAMIITSYHNRHGKGIPLGNLTSQLFSNIYMNHLDQYVKRRLQVPYYVRYADDFVFMSPSKSSLEEILATVKIFLKNELKLELHTSKIIYRKWHRGVDFLGYVIFPYHRVLRTKTKKRIFKKLREKYHAYKKERITHETWNQTVQSYIGRLQHCHGKKIRETIKKLFPYKH